VGNFGSRPRDVEVEVQQDGQPIARERAQIPARGRQTIVVRAAHVGHVIAARLNSEDALQADNQRVTILPPLDRVTVAFRGRDSWFLEKALHAYPNVSLQDGRLNPATPDVLVCNACAGIPTAKRGVLIIPPPTSPSDPALLSIANPDHPLASSLDLAETFVTSLTPEAAKESGDVVLRAGNLPAVTASERDGRRVVELNLDVTRSDLALSTAFPILIANSLDWLAAQNENPLEIAPGEPLRWMLPDTAVADVSVTGPDGRARRVQLSAGQLTMADTDVQGIYSVRTPSAEQFFVVNPSVETESDLIPDETEAASSTAKPKAATAVASRSISGNKPFLRRKSKDCTI